MAHIDHKKHGFIQVIRKGKSEHIELCPPDCCDKKLKKQFSVQDENRLDSMEVRIKALENKTIWDMVKACFKPS